MPYIGPYKPWNEKDIFSGKYASGSNSDEKGKKCFVQRGQQFEDSSMQKPFKLSLSGESVAVL